MASETVSKILQTENKAAENLETARKTAEQIVTNAKIEVTKILQKSKTEAEQEANIKLKQNDEKIKAIWEEKERLYVIEAEAIKQRVQDKVKKAEKTVIAKIID
jgi:vacuolar-type H+-ATPase subunit H